MTRHTVRLNQGAPVREIRPSHRGIRSTATVLLKPVALESTLERDVLALLSMDPNLADVSGQPVRIDVRDAGARARHYTPDVLVLDDAKLPQQVLYEIKYRTDLRVEWPRLDAP